MGKCHNLPFHAVLAAILPFFCFSMAAQTPLDRSDRRTATLVSPYYFGPNAFPVPEMDDGTVCDRLRIELDGEYQPGFRGDRTSDIFVKANIPVFSDRVNLSLWMTAMEWYRNSDRSISECRLSDAVGKYDIESGHLAGDLYVSTDIMLLREGDRCPVSVTVRAALKTASADGWHLGRYYDSPGYFFDGTAGRSFALGTPGGRTSLRLAARGGFLCWQTDNGRQNDAILYGLLARLDLKAFHVSASFSGYSGWENSVRNLGDQAKDRPAVFGSELGYRFDNIGFNVSYRYGMRDFPYHCFRLGMVWHFDI